MIEIITTIGTSIFYLLIVRKYMLIFFNGDNINKVNEKIIGFLFIFITSTVYFIFRHPLANMLGNLLMTYMFAQLYKCQQKDRILVSILIYCTGAFCDILSVYLFSNYIYGGEYDILAAYVAVLLLAICEFVTEQFLVKIKKSNLATPYWKVLIAIPIVSIILISILAVNNINNQTVLVLTSMGILLINLMVFYLYDAIIGAYLKLEGNSILERQNAVYSNQLDVLAQSEENIKSLRHDMRHHLSVLLSLAGKKDETTEYIKNMQTFMENPYEYVSSGNKEIDSLLNFTLNKAKNSLKQVDYKINVPNEMDIRPFDLNIIIGNLMDNAITAANASEEKWLSVTISFEKICCS